jgi:RND family efflux transporter MFP subunit
MKKMIIGLISLLCSLHAAEIYTNFTVAADQSAELAFDAGGTVNKVHVDVASIVKKGDPLASLHSDDIKASLEVAKAALTQAEVSLKFAKKNYERQLKIKKIIDAATFDTYALAYEQAAATVSQAKANVAYSQSLLEKSILYAPFDGIIFEKSVEVGDVVSGMMLRSVFKIQSLSKRKLILEFDQKYWNSVAIGQTFKYSVEGDSTLHEGVISKVYPVAKSKNRKMQAEVEVEKLLVGLFGDGYIITPESR